MYSVWVCLFHFVEKRRKMPRVVFVGNFMVPFSTESHHKWTWERLGWEVTALQENTTTTDAILAACKGAQLLEITHTHGYPMGGSIPPDLMLQKVRDMGIPSFSYHLDLYFGLNTLDRRDERTGNHWSWKVDHFFSTDGGHEAEYKARGVNHHYLPPGVVEYGCYKGEFQQVLASDIGFVGSIGYHPEYPFRTRMVETLKKHYGTRFRTYAGMRERALNNVYASVKVVVGDHCFAGAPFYWSDRLPETCGRGGFLIYPRTEGMTIPTVTYEPQNIDDLISKIDAYLEFEPQRYRIRDECFEHVKKNDTYTQRLREILRVIGL
jgi:hypothetical protein